MKKKHFYNKYGMHTNNHYYYKKKYKDFVIDGKLDYALLDKEFQKRINLREEVKELMASKSGKDIYHLFISDKTPNPRQVCKTWIDRLYMERFRFSINDELYATLRTVYEYLIKDK